MKDISCCGAFQFIVMWSYVMPDGNSLMRSRKMERQPNNKGFIKDWYRLICRHFKLQKNFFYWLRIKPRPEVIALSGPSALNRLWRSRLISTSIRPSNISEGCKGCCPIDWNHVSWIGILKWWHYWGHILIFFVCNLSWDTSFPPFSRLKIHVTLLSIYPVLVL